MDSVILSTEAKGPARKWMRLESLSGQTVKADNLKPQTDKLMKLLCLTVTEAEGRRGGSLLLYGEVRAVISVFFSESL